MLTVSQTFPTFYDRVVMYAMNQSLISPTYGRKHLAFHLPLNSWLTARLSNRGEPKGLIMAKGILTRIIRIVFVAWLILTGFVFWQLR
jgi:hypothetical protein